MVRGLMQGLTGELEGAGVDWLSATAKWGNGGIELEESASRVLHFQAREGHEVKAWRGLGYVGEQTEGVTWGRREDSCYASVSGEAAWWHWLPICEAAGKVTRVDLQATVSGIPAGFDLADLSLGAVDQAPRSRGRRIGWSQVRSDETGSTLYLGSVQSASRARLYDKSYEQDKRHLGGRWRYEVQYREQPAEQIAGALLACDDTTAMAVGTVHAHFGERGVAPVFTPTDHVARVRWTRAERDAARTLRWLEKQIAPAVQRLCEEGYRADVLRALQLDKTELDRV